MVQIYLITEVYLILASAIFLSERYGADILILFNLKSLFESKTRYRAAAIVSGLILIVALCLIPMDPGPAFIGDLLPVLGIISVVSKLLQNKNSLKTGYFALICAGIHMVAPSIVIL